MEYKEIKKDLFKLDKKYALAHCISKDCNMGAGIAVTFNSQFKEMRPSLLNRINKNNLKYPITVKYVDETTDRVIFNLITKELYWHKPTYSTITETIKQMAWFCQKENITHLAMPKIGCGIDRLNWKEVSEIIKKEFSELDIEIVVCYL